MIRRRDLGPAFEIKKWKKIGEHVCIGESEVVFWVPFLIETFYYYFEDMEDASGPCCNYDGDDTMSCLAINYDKSFGRSKILIKYKCSQLKNIKWGVGGRPF